MDQVTKLSCACGKVHLQVSKAPIIAAECYCSSCRAAGRKIEAMPGAKPFMTAGDGTPFVMYRKDRVRFTQGLALIKSFRLGPDRTTRRAIASCCNTPIFLEFKGGHWLSLYGALWPAGTTPKPELRTMTGDLPEGTVLAGDVPEGAWATAGFYGRLLGAWIAMGFKVPKVEIADEIVV